MLQRTLAKSISVTGVGLHSGERVALTCTLRPKTAGFPFRRTDLDGEMGRNHQTYALPHQRYAPASTIVTDKGVRVGTDRTHHVRAVRLRHRQCAD